MIKRIAPYIALAGLVGGCDNIQTTGQPIGQQSLETDILRLVELVKADPKTERDRTMYVTQGLGTVRLPDDPNQLPHTYVREILVDGKKVRIDYRDCLPNEVGDVGTPDDHIGKGDILEITINNNIFRDRNVNGFPSRENASVAESASRDIGGDCVMTVDLDTDFNYGKRFGNRIAAENLYASVVRQAIAQLKRDSR